MVHAFHILAHCHVLTEFWLPGTSLGNIESGKNNSDDLLVRRTTCADENNASRTLCGPRYCLTFFVPVSDPTCQHKRMAGLRPSCSAR